jgi:hypothetical protein
MLSQYVETRHAIRLLQEAPQRIGYMSKDRVSDISEFADAIRRIARGGSVIDPEVVAGVTRPARASRLARSTDHAGTGDPRPFGRRSIEPSDLRTAIPFPEDRREPHRLNLLQARTRAQHGRSSAGSRRRDVPAGGVVRGGKTVRGSPGGGIDQIEHPRWLVSRHAALGLGSQRPASGRPEQPG